MAVIYEDVTFALSEDVDFALPASAWAEGGDIGEWLVESGLLDIDSEADVGTWLSNIGSNALNFGATGATVGGPWGALIGGLLGAGLGAAQTVAADQQQQPKPGAPRPPAANPAPSAPRPAQSGPPATAGGTDVTAILAALRDVLPALTAIASQMDRPRPAEGVAEAEPLPEVAPDWSLESDWPYAREGVTVASEDEPETLTASRPAEAAEEVPPESAEELTGESETSTSEGEDGDDESAEQLAAPGEAYAGAGLAQIGEET
jgi:hypothetical protein